MRAPPLQIRRGGDQPVGRKRPMSGEAAASFPSRSSTPLQQVLIPDEGARPTAEAVALQARVSQLEAENARLLRERSARPAPAPAPPLAPRASPAPAADGDAAALRRRLLEAEEQIFDLLASIAVIEAEAKHEVELGCKSLRSELAFKTEELQRASRSLQRLSQRVSTKSPAKGEAPLQDVDGFTVPPPRPRAADPPPPPSPPPPPHRVDDEAARAPPLAEPLAESAEPHFDSGVPRIVFDICKVAIARLEDACPVVRGAVAQIGLRAAGGVDLLCRALGNVVAAASDAAPAALEVAEALVCSSAVDLCEDSAIVQSALRLAAADGALRTPALRLVAALAPRSDDAEWWAAPLFWGARRCCGLEAVVDEALRGGDDGAVESMLDLFETLSLAEGRAARFDDEVWPDFADACRAVAPREQPDLARRLHVSAIAVASTICVDDAGRAAALLASRTSHRHQRKRSSGPEDDAAGARDTVAANDALDDANHVDLQAAKVGSCFGRKRARGLLDALLSTGEAPLPSPSKSGVFDCRAARAEARPLRRLIRSSDSDRREVEFARRVLQLLGHVVFFAQDPEATLEILFGFDAVDVLPRHDIIALCERLLYASARDPGASQRDAELLLERLGHPCVPVDL
ncbi:hypothetical protein M885DRAFT_589433 [Pelagophyceae sp. CCMP2097]|nr:hypothetical protein M885DRAFT_589433 [Pelagophyceae sp. CCMP2097]